MEVPDKFRSYRKPDGSVARRPLREQVYMTLAVQMAKQGTCDRLKVGSVFTDPSMSRILCAGYNGSHAGGPNGCDTNEPGSCGCLHSEVNAITQAREDLTHAVCFVTTAPCKMCAKVLVNRRVSRVVYLNDYRLNEGLDILKGSGVEVTKYDDLPG